MPYDGRKSDKLARKVENDDDDDDEKLAVGPTVYTLPLTFSLLLRRSYDETRTIREGDDRTKQLLVASREVKKHQRVSERVLRHSRNLRENPWKSRRGGA